MYFTDDPDNPGVRAMLDPNCPECGRTDLPDAEAGSRCTGERVALQRLRGTPLPGQPERIVSAECHAEALDRLHQNRTLGVSP
jgi:hypothetical protein